MEPSLQFDVDAVISNWLDAREDFLHGVGSRVLDRFTNSNMYLFAAFVQDWHGDPNDRAVTVAFHQFRKFLMQEADKGDPSRLKYHPCPIMVARA